MMMMIINGNIDKTICTFERKNTGNAKWDTVRLAGAMNTRPLRAPGQPSIHDGGEGFRIALVARGWEAIKRALGRLALGSSMSPAICSSSFPASTRARAGFGRASPEEAFSASLYQMELERLRYSLSKYLRTRLRKVERDALHVLSSAEEDMQGRLSDR